MGTPNTTFQGRNWLRYAQLSVLKATNDVAINISNINQETTVDQVPTPGLRFRFEVRADDLDSPNSLSVRIYNLSDNTAKTIINEFDRVVLAAGYQEGAKGNIFEGTIQQLKRGRERSTDNYLDIFAADGDLPRNNAVLNTSRPAGATDNQLLSEFAKAMNIPIAQSANGFVETGGVYPRGKVLWGMGKDYMKVLAKKNKCRWSIQSGTLTLIPNDGYLTGNEIVELNSWSGMLGVPESTENGIEVSCYLNPQIQVGQLVRINNKEINQASRSGPIMFPQRLSQYYPASTSADGVYRVLVVEHTGDVRGNEWRTDLTCLTVDVSSKSVPTN